MSDRSINSVFLDGSVPDEPSIWNMTPVVGTVSDKDNKALADIVMTPTCFCDDRMHVHCKSQDHGEIEFWLETEGTPEITLKDSKNFKGNVNEFKESVKRQQRLLIRKWLAYAKDHATGHRYFPRAWDFAVKHGFVDKNETFESVKKELQK